MSTTIDERVVEMRFDNKQFENNVQTSLSTIQKLRQSLKLDDAAKGLDGVSAAAKRVDLSGISGAAETVGLKFSAMYTIADQALRNITNSAVNYGKRIVSALTIDPIKTGLSEYETQIGAVQTILANTESKGTTLEDVNGALDTLNKYADKTIYNFTEMTRNIGTFTAAGVDLDTSVKSIQGIANLAAVSGSTSQQASTAMYQLSQALAAGKVSLMDWNSVVNAGMGGQVFQDALKRTATAMGTDVDALIKKYGSFRESLTQGEWLTADVLTKTLEQFTMSAKEGTEQWEKYKQSLMEEGYTAQQAEDILKMANTAENAATKVKTFSQLWDTLKETAQSGWTQTWEILVGDFEEAKETLSKASEVLGDLVNGMSEARNTLLQGWKDLGGRTALIDAIKNAFTGVMNVVKPIGEAFREIFPALKAEQLLSVTEKLRDGLGKFAEAFKAGSKNAENLKRTFKGVFAVVDIVRQVFVAAIKAVASMFGVVGDLGGGVLGVTATIGDWLVKLRDAITAGDIFNKVFQGVASVIRTVVGFALKLAGAGLEVFRGILEGIGSSMSNIGGVANGMKNRVVEAVDRIGSAFENCGFFKFVSSLGKALATIAIGIGKAFGSLIGGLFEKLSNVNFSGVMDFFNALTVGGIAVAITKFVKSFSNFTDGIGDALGSFGDFKDGIVGILDGVKGTFEAYQTQLKAGTLMKIAQAIALLTAAIVVLSFIDSAKLSASLGAITVLFTDLMVAMGLFSRVSGDLKNTAKAVTGMMGLATAVLILSFALTNVARLSPSELITGMAGVVGLTAVMVGVAKALSKNGKTVVKGATQMILFAAAVKILASVVKSLADLNVGQLAKGLVGVGVLLAEVALFLNNAKFSGKAMSTATGIVILAAALKILASATKDFATMSVPELVKGLSAVGLVLAALVGFTKFTSGSSGMVGLGIGMIAIATSMKIFASAVRDMGSMNIETIGKGLLTMAGALAIIAVAVKFIPNTLALTGVGFIAMATGLLILSSALNSMGNMSWESIAKSMIVLAGAFTILCTGLHFMSSALPGAAALLVVTAALAIFAPVLALLGSMSWGTIITGLITIAGAFTILGVAGTILAPIVPVILGLAGAIALLGVGILGIGAGIALLSVGLTALATGITGSAAVISATLVAIVTSIISLIPLVLQKIGEGIVAICGVIANSGAAICGAIATILLAVIQAIVQVIPPLMECLGLILSELLKFIIDYAPQIVEAGVTLILALLQGIASKIGDITAAAIEIIIKFIDGIASGIGRVIESGINLMISFINGLADGIRKNTPLMIDAVDNLMNAVMEAIVAWFVGAIKIGGELAGKVAEGIGKSVSALFQAGKDAIQGFINGIKSMLSKVGDIAGEIGGKALDKIKSVLGIKSPSREFMAVGKFSGEGMIKGLNMYSGKVSKAAEGMGSSALDSMKTAVSGLADAISGDIDAQPTIRPVLDLSNVQSGANAISSLLNGDRSMGVLANVGAISSTMRHNGQNGTSGEIVSAINKLRQDIGKVGGTSYNINGVTYDDGSNVANAIATIVREARMERRR